MTIASDVYHRRREFSSCRTAMKHHYFMAMREEIPGDEGTYEPGSTNHQNSHAESA